MAETNFHNNLYPAPLYFQNTIMDSEELMRRAADGAYQWYNEGTARAP
jgi:hypothetical protein